MTSWHRRVTAPSNPVSDSFGNGRGDARNSSPRFDHESPAAGKSKERDTDSAGHAPSRKARSRQSLSIGMASASMFDEGMHRQAAQQHRVMHGGGAVTESEGKPTHLGMSMSEANGFVDDSSSSTMTRGGGQ